MVSEKVLDCTHNAAGLLGLVRGVEISGFLEQSLEDVSEECGYQVRQRDGVRQIVSLHFSLKKIGMQIEMTRVDAGRYR